MKNGDRTNLGATGIGTVNPMDKGVSATRLPVARRSDGRTAGEIPMAGRPEARVVAAAEMPTTERSDGRTAAEIPMTGFPEARVAAVERTMVERPTDGCAESVLPVLRKKVVLNLKR